METRYYLGYRYPRTRRGRVCALPVGLGRPDPPPYQFARPDARPEPWRIVRARRSCRMCDLCRACLLPLLRSLGHGLCTRPLRRTARHPIGDRAGTSGRDPAEPHQSQCCLGRAGVSRSPNTRSRTRGEEVSSQYNSSHQSQRLGRAGVSRSPIARPSTRGEEVSRHHHPSHQSQC